MGAAADRSVDTVFKGIAEAGKRAAQEVRDAFKDIGLSGTGKRGGGSQGGNADVQALKSSMAARTRVIREAARADVAITRAKLQELRQLHQQQAKLEGQKAKTRAAGQSSAVQDAKEELSQLRRIWAERSANLRDAQRKDAEVTRKATQEMERARQKRIRDEERQNRQQPAGGRGRRGRDLADMGQFLAFGAGYRAISMVANAPRALADVALGGLGVELSPTEGLRKSVALESRMTDVSNAAYMPGAKGAAGMRVAPERLMAQARQIAAATGTKAEDIGEGLASFVGKTGDLDTGRKSLMDMAKLSQATGANLADMVNAAGDVSTVLGDIPDKGKAIFDVMRHIAAQGKLGAVEVKDLASQMAKLAAASQSFAGGRSENLAQMGALAQLARQHGGAASATQAATSVAGFVDMLRTPARAKAFERETGVSVFSKKKGEEGLLRPVVDIITDALKKTGGDALAFKSIFANKIGGKSAEALAATFHAAGGGDTGVEAVRKEFEGLAQTVMSLGEIEESFTRKMMTTESRVNVFNEKLAATADSLKLSLIGPLEVLGPKVVDLAKKISDFITGDTEADRAIKGGANAQLDEREWSRKAKNLLAKMPVQPDEVVGTPALGQWKSLQDLALTPFADPEEMGAGFVGEGLERREELQKHLMGARDALKQEEEKMAVTRRQTMANYVSFGGGDRLEALELAGKVPEPEIMGQLRTSIKNDKASIAELDQQMEKVGTAMARGFLVELKNNKIPVPADASGRDDALTSHP